MRLYVEETETKVPFPLIDFDETNDGAGKAIREIIPKWNVSTSELKAFQSGDYNSFAPLFSGLTMPDISQAMQLFADTWRYITPTGTDTIAEAAINKIMRSVSRNLHAYWMEKDRKTMMDYVLENPDHELSRQIHYPVPIADMGHNYVREANLDMCYMIRNSLTEQFILGLLTKIRELLQVAEPLDTIMANRARLVVPEFEDPKREHWPFQDSQCALTALITCLHFILMDHRTIYACRDSYRSIPEDASTDGFRESGNIDWASHWSMLYQYLRKDIEANGPVPEELKFFHGSVELASRLERVPWQRYSRLGADRPEAAQAIIPVIAAAREYYAIEHENWGW